MDSITQLTQNMTQNEKRYFVRRASLHNPAAINYYFQLYEDYTKGTQHAKKWSLSKLTATKHQLYLQLLDSLRSYHEQNNTLKVGLNYLESFRILQKKGLPELAEKERLKGLKYITSINAPLLHLIYLEEQKKYWVRQSNAETLEKRRSETEIKTSHLIQSIQETRVISDFYLQAEYINKKYEGTRSSIERNELRDLIKKIEEIQPITSHENKILQHFSLGILKYLEGHYIKSNSHFKNALLLLDSDKQLKQKFEELYIRSLANSCLNQIHEDQGEDITFYLEEMVNQTYQEESLKKLTFYLVQLISMMQDNKNGDFSSAIQSYKKLETEVKNVKNWGNQENTYLTFQLTSSLIGLNREKEASKVLYQFIHNPTNLLKTDALITARIIFIGFKWIQNDHFFVENEIRSLERFLLLKDKYFTTEKEILRLFKKELISTGKEELKTMIEKTIQSLKKLRKIPEEKNAFLYFDYINWIKQLGSFIKQ
jgi:hypothetical protein